MWTQTAANIHRSIALVEERGEALTGWIEARLGEDLTKGEGVPWLVGRSGYADLAHLVDLFDEIARVQRAGGRDELPHD